MALEKPAKLRELFLLLCGHPALSELDQAVEHVVTLHEVLYIQCT